MCKVHVHVFRDGFYHNVDEGLGAKFDSIQFILGGNFTYYYSE
jgi:hypothetical protein